MVSAVSKLAVLRVAGRVELALAEPDCEVYPTADLATFLDLCGYWGLYELCKIALFDLKK